jgi:hypothetical protein
MHNATPFSAKPPPSASLSPSTPTAAPQAWLAALALLAAFALLAHGPIAQPASYHAFADARELVVAGFALPHFMDVFTNLPFLIVGALGFRSLRLRTLGPSSLGLSAVQGTARPAALAWRAFFIAVMLTCAGSGFYHWAPNNFGLAFDRAPIALACGFLLCAFMAERFHEKWASLSVLAVFSAISLAAVGYWVHTEAQGAGDLRPYLYLQFLPMVLIPLGVFLTRQTPVTLGSVSTTTWLAPLALYAAAKAAELADEWLFQALGFISGHSLKHLLAAAAVGVLVIGLRRAQRRTA